MKTFCAAFLLVSMTACSSTSGTGGNLVTFQWKITAQPTPEQNQLSTTNDLGWNIVLTQAQLRVGPVYLQEKAPALGWYETLWNWVLPSAHAHAGDDFFAGGRVYGEWLPIETLDLTSLEAPRVLEEKSVGVAGRIRSFSVGFGSKPLKLQGVATRGGERVEFSFESVEGMHPSTERVEFVPAELELADQANLTVKVNWERWFDGVQMESLQSEPSTLTTTQAYRAIHFNLRRNSAWSLTTGGL